MRRKTPAALVAALSAFVCAMSVSTANADLADRCRVDAQSLTTAGGAFKPTITYKVYDCPTPNYAWNVIAKCQKAVTGGWVLCNNTSPDQEFHNGPVTATIPVGNGGWACAHNVIYRGFASIYDPDTGAQIANITANHTLC